MAARDVAAQEERERFAAIVRRKRVVVCAGSGGVGKTTISAVVALNAAIAGKRALVLTIDPARRLANSLGVSELDNEPRPIALEQFRTVGLEPRGELWAMMLDMKQSYDDLVDRYAPDADARHSILRNRFYQSFSTSLAGTQEYAAAERLYELYTEGNWDLVVLDTPPTAHALDFLEAPDRLVDAIDNRAMQWLHGRAPSARLGSGLLGVGAGYALKILGKLAGGEMLTELSDFLRAFSTLFGGFKVRAARVRELMTSDVSTFVVVCAPNQASVDEAIYFHERLGTEQVHVGGLVVNRVHPSWVPPEDLGLPVGQLTRELAAGQGGPQLAALEEGARRDLSTRLRENAAQFQVVADLDQASIKRLRERIGGRDSLPVVPVPYFSRDIHSLEGLDHVRRALFP